MILKSADALESIIADGAAKEAEIVRLREENRTIRESSVSHEVFQTVEAERDDLRRQLDEKTELLDKAVEDMSVGWLCYRCTNRVPGDEWARCKKQVFKDGPEDTAMCANFKWRGGAEKRAIEFEQE